MSAQNLHFPSDFPRDPKMGSQNLHFPSDFPQEVPPPKMSSPIFEIQKILQLCLVCADTIKFCAEVCHSQTPPQKHLS